MGQYFKTVNRSHARIALRALMLTLRVMQRLLRVLLRPPLIDVLFLLFVLWLIAGLIGRVNQPQGVLQQPPTVFEGR